MGRTRLTNSSEMKTQLLAEHEKYSNSSSNESSDIEEESSYSPPNLNSNSASVHQFFPSAYIPSIEYFPHEEMQSIRIKSISLSLKEGAKVTRSIIEEKRCAEANVAKEKQENLLVTEIELTEVQSVINILANPLPIHPVVTPLITPSEIPSTFQSLITHNCLGLKIWPVVFLGLLSHDLGHFILKPEDRYGDTLANIFLGLPVSQWNNFMSGRVKANENTWLNHLGTDDVADYFCYWAAPVAVILTPPVILLTQAGIRKLGNYNFINPVDAEISKIRCSITYLSRGYSAYAYLYFAVLCLQKVIDTVHYLENKAECERKNKVYSMIPFIADYLCTIGGDWEDLNLSLIDMNTSQGCINGLLANKIPPGILLERIQRFINFPDFTDLDLSQMQYSLWSDEQLQQFFNTVTLVKKNSSLNVVNLSSDEFNTISLTPQKVISIANFVKNTSINQFIFKNQIIQLVLLRDFFQGFLNASVTLMDITNTIVGDVGARLMGEVLPYTNITTAIVNHCGISDLAFSDLIAGASSSKLITIFADANALTDVSLIAMVNKTNIHAISLDSMAEFTAEGLGQWSNAWSPSQFHQ